ncbi:Predicted Zn-dependent peptidase [Pilibacter termitis]|uniref:Predicted Zn-dependent peptidase n=1 Tax=Pilibacter termitis TaxID=263852 RepID=A0A1T4M4T8_9ENTE|nr:pitrilysin family protein [Pilibacter termitis]SJZ61754.1 Predicted Zn-dependent peptidase [Pilibacter termitis]
MSIQLRNGIYLSVVPTQKFKTIRILLRFQTKLTEEVVSKRALLTSLLETNSKNYPTQTAIAQKLSSLYGASINMYVTRKGQLHFFNVALSVVNDKYLEEKGVLEDALAFLQELLFKPNAYNGKFDEKTFEIEKQNLMQYLDSMREDKQYFASLKLNELFFHNAGEQAMSSIGRSEDLEKLTSEEMFSYYREMLSTDEVDIIVAGDVEENEMIQAFSKMPFVDRLLTPVSLYFSPEESNIIREGAKQEKLSQSKLNLAYRMPVKFDSKEYYALQVFNGIFGGFAHSRLFLNIREKESMAYYASSSFDSFRGLFTIQTGIDGKNRKKVLHLIHKELESIKLGNVGDLELLQTKEMLKNAFLLSQDSSSTLIEEAFMKRKMPFVNREKEQWLTQIDAVSKEMVVEIARALKLSAIFFLEGSEGEGLGE